MVKIQNNNKELRPYVERSYLNILDLRVLNQNFSWAEKWVSKIQWRKYITIIEDWLLYVMWCIRFCNKHTRIWRRHTYYSILDGSRIPRFKWGRGLYLLYVQDSLQKFSTVLLLVSWTFAPFDLTSKSLKLIKRVSQNI